MHDYYHSSNFHLLSPFYRRPEFFKPCLYYYRNIKDQKFQETIEACSSHVNVNVGAGFVIKEGKELIRFGYALDPAKGGDITDLVANNLPLLKKFNEYFLRETQDIVKRAMDDFVHLPTAMGELYNVMPKGLGKFLTPYEKSKFLEKLGLLEKIREVNLSPREIDCLKYLHNGLTARQSGIVLGISQRSVEHYLESTKNKLNCYTKEDLFKKAQLLHLADYF